MTEPLTIDEFIDYAVSLGCDRDSAEIVIDFVTEDNDDLGYIADLLEQVAKAKEKR